MNQLNKPVNTDKKQKNTKFSKGQSGNPNGRPKGSLNKSTIVARSMFESEIEEVSQKVIELAKSGDIQAIKIIIDRIIAPKKENSITFPFQDIINSTDLIQASNSIISSASNGHITISEAKDLVSLLDSMRRNIEIEDLEKRLEKLENYKN